MKKQIVTFGFMLFGAAALLLSSCKKKDKGEENDEEVITTVQLTFAPEGGGNTLVYKYDDPDGPGGAAATQDEIVLAPNKTYNVTLLLLNKTTNPVTNVTAEVVAEAGAHRVYYQPTAGSNITVSQLNLDPANIPLGTTSKWMTGAAATGKVMVTLRHYPGNPPNKGADDPVNSNKSVTDVEVNFNTRIQ